MAVYGPEPSENGPVCPPDHTAKIISFLGLWRPSVSARGIYLRHKLGFFPPLARQPRVNALAGAIAPVIKLLGDSPEQTTGPHHFERQELPPGPVILHDSARDQ